MSSSKSKIIIVFVIVVLLGAGLATYNLCCGQKKRVLFITIDTLRADHLSAYKYPVKTSPFIDSLAETATVFDYALTASSHTAPSHTTMFTSLYPFQHNVLANHEKLKAGVPTIYSVFNEAKVPVAAFPATRFMDGKVGFPALPAKQDIPEAAINAKTWYRLGSVQVDRVINWFNKFQTGDDFFVWLHFYDVHAWGQEEHEGIPDEHFTATLPADVAAHVKYLKDAQAITPEFHGGEAQLIKAINSYDARLHFVDAQIKRLADYLKSKNLWDGTLVVITADHGEGLGNHDYAGHGQYIYQEQLHVPLIFNINGRTQSARFSEQVRTVDIFPTIADIMGLEIPANPIPRQGASLYSFIKKAQSSKLPEFAFAQRRPRDEARIRRNWQEGDFHALQNKHWKLISHSDGKHELFNLEEDPFELNNLYSKEPDLFKNYHSLLGKILKLPALTGSGTTVEQLDQSELDELRSLGYL